MLPLIIIYLILGLVSAVITFVLFYKLGDPDPELVAFFTLLLWPAFLPMFIAYYLKHKKPKDMKLERIDEPKEQRCTECGGMFLESKMHKVNYDSHGRLLYGFSDRYYCVIHKVPYDRVTDQAYDRIQYFKTIPAHEVEVDVNGVEIKPKKK